MLRSADDIKFLVHMDAAECSICSLKEIKRARQGTLWWIKADLSMKSHRANEFLMYSGYKVKVIFLSKR